MALTRCWEKEGKTNHCKKTLCMCRMSCALCIHVLVFPNLRLDVSERRIQGNNLRNFFSRICQKPGSEKKLWLYLWREHSSSVGRWYGLLAIVDQSLSYFFRSLYSVCYVDLLVCRSYLIPIIPYSASALNEFHRMPMALCVFRSKYIFDFHSRKRFSCHKQSFIRWMKLSISI